MTRIFIGAACLLVAVSASAQSVQPNLDQTPGLARPLSTTTICATKWAAFEIDHLVSRELGGADDVKNLWSKPGYPGSVGLAILARFLAMCLPARFGKR